MLPPPDLMEMKRESALEFTLYVQLEQAGLPLPAWHVEIAGHETDFTWPEPWLIIVEVQGGTAGYGKGRGSHVREPGYSRDRMYSNRRQVEGWRVFEFTATHIHEEEALSFLREVLT